VDTKQRNSHVCRSISRVNSVCFINLRNEPVVTVVFNEIIENAEETNWDLTAPNRRLTKFDVCKSEMNPGCPRNRVVKC